MLLLLQVPSVLPDGVTSSVAFIPGSSALLLFTSPCLGPSALLFDFRAGSPFRQLQLSSIPTSLAVAPAGQLFAFGLLNGQVLLADAASESSTELRACSSRHVGVAGPAVQSVAFAVGGRQLLAAVGSVLTVWDA